jgi:ribosome maturation factor RimP
VSVTALPSHVQELADRVATGHGVEVLELTLRGQGRGRVLSVILDAEEPVEADVVEQVSKDLSRALDQADPVPGSYTLQVSTPGLSRPLHTARDFRRQRGHEVSIIRDRTPTTRDVGDRGDGGAGGSGEAASARDGEPAGRPGDAASARDGEGRGAGTVRQGGTSPIQGVVVDADDEAVVLDVDGSQVRVPLSEVVRGKVVLPW